MKETIEAVIFEKENGNKNRTYIGRFIGITNKEQTSAIVNNPILQKRLTHLQTKNIKFLGAYSDEIINNMRAVLVVNKIGKRDVTKFLYFTELLDSVTHSSAISTHMITKKDGYIMFTKVNKNSKCLTDEK